jgi:hypothetical protein
MWQTWGKRVKQKMTKVIDAMGCDQSPVLPKRNTKVRLMMAIGFIGLGSFTAQAQPYERDDRGPPPGYEDRGPPRHHDEDEDQHREERRHHDEGRDEEFRHEEEHRQREHQEHEEEERRRHEWRGDEFRHDEDDGPPPRMVCIIRPPPGIPLPGLNCETRPGPPGSPCKCGDAPFEGRREVER